MAIAYRFLDKDKKHIKSFNNEPCFGQIPKYVKDYESIRDGAEYLSLQLPKSLVDHDFAHKYLDLMRSWYFFGDVIEEKSSQEILESGWITVNARNNSTFRTYTPLHFARYLLVAHRGIERFIDELGDITDPTESLVRFIKQHALIDSGNLRTSYYEFNPNTIVYNYDYDSVPAPGKSFTSFIGYLKWDDLVANHPERIFEPEYCPTIFEKVRGGYEMWYGSQNCLWKANKEAIQAGEGTKFNDGKINYTNGFKYYDPKS